MLQKELIVFKGGDFRDYLNNSEPVVYSELGRNGELAMRVMPMFVGSTCFSYAISVQASWYNCCIPKITLPDFYEYETFECAIVYKDEMVNNPVGLLANFKHIDRLFSYFRLGFFSNVPADLVQEVIEFICSIEE